MAEVEATGRTRKIRAGLIFGAGLVGVGVLFVGMAQGSLAASFAISGTQFKSSADKLVGTGFEQFGTVDNGPGGSKNPVMATGVSTASATNFCQSTSVSLPIVGTVNLKLAAPQMSAKDMVLDVTSIDGDLTLTQVQIGKDASTLDGPAKGAAGAFGLQAATQTVNGFKTQAWSATAASLTLQGLKLNFGKSVTECF
jgi:F0F1-type ATP synthase membrane subunit c/vacuolar-type H+-ATPase subunit K